jgi:hypothetical protein
MKLPSIKRLAQDSDLALLTVLTLIFAPIMDDEGLAWTHLLANTLNANDYDYVEFNLERM